MTSNHDSCRYPSVYQQQQGQADDTDGSGWVHVNDDPSLLRDRNVSNGNGGGGSGSGANSLLDYDVSTLPLLLFPLLPVCCKI